MALCVWGCLELAVLQRLGNFCLLQSNILLKLRDGIALCVELWMPGSVGGGSLVEDFSQSHQLCHSDLLPSTHILEPIPGHTIMRNIVQRIQGEI